MDKRGKSGGLMSELVKNQHYVPQRYLKYFANTIKKKKKTISRLNVFDKEKLEIRVNPLSRLFKAAGENNRRIFGKVSA